MHYSMREIAQTFTPEKKKNTSLWDRVFCRPLSFPIAYLLINLGITANTVSVFSGVIGMAGCFLMMIGGSLVLPGILLLLLFNVLDAVDGNIARAKGQWSAGGEFFDGAGGTLGDAFLYLAIGVGAYHTAVCPPAYKPLFIVLGATASIADCAARCVYHRYLIAEYKLGLVQSLGSMETRRKKGKLGLVNRVRKEFGTMAFFMPLLVLSYLFRRLDVLTALYFLYAVSFGATSVCFLLQKGAALAPLPDRDGPL